MKNLLCMVIVVLLLFSGCSNEKPEVDNLSVENSNAYQKDTTEVPDVTQHIQNNKEIVVEEIITDGPQGVSYYFNNGMGLFIYNEKFGYINEQGNVVIEPKYRYGECFYEDYAIVSKTDNTMAIIDKMGNEIPLSDEYTFMLESFEYKFSEKQQYNKFINGIAMVRIDHRKNSNYERGFAAIDTSGNEVFRVIGYTNYVGVVKGNYMFDHTNGYNRKAVIVDNTGKNLTQFTFDYRSNSLPVLNCQDGLILAQLNIDGTFLSGVIDTNGNSVIDYIHEELREPSEGMIAFKKYGKWGYIDYSGKVIIEPTYDEAYPFYNELAPVKVGNLIGFINKENEMIIEPTYDSKLINDHRYFKFRDNGIAAVSQSPVIFIDKEGQSLKLEGILIEFYLKEEIFTLSKGSTNHIYRFKN